MVANFDLQFEYAGPIIDPEIIRGNKAEKISDGDYDQIVILNLPERKVIEYRPGIYYSHHPLLEPPITIETDSFEVVTNALLSYGCELGAYRFENVYNDWEFDYVVTGEPSLTHLFGTNKEKDLIIDVMGVDGLLEGEKRTVRFNIYPRTEERLTGEPLNKFYVEVNELFRHLESLKLNPLLSIKTS